MKICVTSQGDNLDSQVDPRFGRCQYFIIYDSETESFEAIRNSNIIAGGGAGVQSGQLVANKQVDVVLSGNIGPNAFQTLQAAGIKIITGLSSGSVQKIIEKYKTDDLEFVQSSTVDSKFGTGSIGRGGFGRKMKGGNNTPFSDSDSVQQEGLSREEEFDRLEQEAKDLEQQAKEIRRKLAELKEKLSL